MENYEELVERAIIKIVKGGEDNLKLAIWDLQKARENIYDEGKRKKCELLGIFVEILSGLKPSKEKYNSLFLDGAWYAKVGDSGDTRIDNLRKAVLPSFIETFLNKELPEIWLKSLKYDAIKAEFQKSENEEKRGQFQIEKIKTLIGDERID